MRSDDAVETFKRHIEDEESATQTWHPGDGDPDIAVPEFARQSLDVLKNK